MTARFGIIDAFPNRSVYRGSILPRFPFDNEVIKRKLLPRVTDSGTAEFGKAIEFVCRKCHGNCLAMIAYHVRSLAATQPHQGCVRSNVELVDAIL